MAFEGFPKSTFDFLSGIAKNNDKSWFEANRSLYDEGYVEAAKDFVTALGPRMKKIDREVKFEPKVGGSLMRIFRDVRFSKDKSPYKTHLDAWLWTGPDKGWDAPGYFFRMFHDQLLLGAGMHAFEKETLAKYRAAVIDAKKGKALEKAIADVERAGLNVGGATRKKVPKGFDPEHPRAKYLLHDGLYADWSGKVPKEARNAKLLDWCADRFEHASPIAKWLRTALA